MLKAGIVGFGGIAQTKHVPGWKILEEKGLGKLIAACDIDENQFTKKQEINIGSSDVKLNINKYTDLEKMLTEEDLDIIDICTPTPLHSSITVSLLKRGYHVHCEKPMARNSILCKEMLDAAAESGNGKLMIGQCLRFSDPYLFVKEAIKKNTFGKPLSGAFRRISSPPVWAWNNWFMDHSKSGGCLLDMHIHDIDMIRFLFGEPDYVSCCTQNIYSSDDVAHSRLIYNDFSVIAIGDWSQQGIGFICDYHIGFEKATLVLVGSKVTVYPREGEPWSPEYDNKCMYTKELEYFLTTVIPGKENTINSPESAAKSIKLIETLKESAEQNGANLKFSSTI